MPEARRAHAGANDLGENCTLGRREERTTLAKERTLRRTSEADFLDRDWFCVARKRTAGGANQCGDVAGRIGKKKLVLGAKIQPALRGAWPLLPCQPN